uniref:DUF4211 domain-containing protein n=1 Tax=Chromera velia CCMP2878 TaxID=1169474 RepID=A0A0G4GNE5_9ALVE|eukprot:Cvel_22664.t1-p1 / transcript=Cvel_22664.t1 / gene=Cvel_22664 / organism=Chromera_velia_CCMP2878 / gene_product=hypothetical protein / transcript_product=hypothetical protein / location=Cvel_scaffold2252:4978-12335(+) / protein_length=791 / sequence_SO=supercontig / SO=protein_coding / is_pseudo=false
MGKLKKRPLSDSESEEADPPPKRKGRLIRNDSDDSDSDNVQKIPKRGGKQRRLIRPDSDEDEQDSSAKKQKPLGRNSRLANSAAAAAAAAAVQSSGRGKKRNAGQAAASKPHQQSAVDRRATGVSAVSRPEKPSENLKTEPLSRAERLARLANQKKEDDQRRRERQLGIDHNVVSVDSDSDGGSSSDEDEEEFDEEEEDSEEEERRKRKRRQGRQMREQMSTRSHRGGPGGGASKMLAFRGDVEAWDREKRRGGQRGGLEDDELSSGDSFLAADDEIEMASDYEEPKKKKKKTKKRERDDKENSVGVRKGKQKDQNASSSSSSAAASGSKAKEGKGKGKKGRLRWRSEISSSEEDEDEDEDSEGGEGSSSENDDSDSDGRDSDSESSSEDESDDEGPVNEVLLRRRFMEGKIGGELEGSADSLSTGHAFKRYVEFLALCLLSPTLSYPVKEKDLKILSDEAPAGRGSAGKGKGAKAKDKKAEGKGKGEEPFAGGESWGYYQAAIRRIENALKIKSSSQIEGNWPKPFKEVLEHFPTLQCKDDTGMYKGHTCQACNRRQTTQTRLALMGNPFDSKALWNGDLHSYMKARGYKWLVKEAFPDYIDPTTCRSETHEIVVEDEVMSSDSETDEDEMSEEEKPGGGARLATTPTMLKFVRDRFGSRPPKRRCVAVSEFKMDVRKVFKVPKLEQIYSLYRKYCRKVKVKSRFVGTLCGQRAEGFHIIQHWKAELVDSIYSELSGLEAEVLKNPLQAAKTIRSNKYFLEEWLESYEQLLDQEPIEYKRNRRRSNDFEM